MAAPARLAIMANTVFREREHKLRVAEMSASCESNEPNVLLEDAYA